jgi:hypothetical protein
VRAAFDRAALPFDISDCGRDGVDLSNGHFAVRSCRDRAPRAHRERSFGADGLASPTDMRRHACGAGPASGPIDATGTVNHTISPTHRLAEQISGIAAVAATSPARCTVVTSLR